jgi:hypothetical protein
MPATTQQFAATKTDDGKEYPPSAYLYVPDPESPSTWKLRIWETPETKVTRRQLGLAAAALSPGGMMGNRVQLPAAAETAAKKALVREYHKLDVPDDEIPSYLTASEPTGSDVHVNNPGTGNLGNSPPALRRRNGKRRGLDDTLVQNQDDMMGDDDDDWDDTTGPQLEKADARVKYRPSSEFNQRCGTCRFIDADHDACNLVEGMIDPSFVCDLWTVQIAAGSEPDYGMFVGFSEEDFSKPQWIPFLPKPGKYNHPMYGEIAVTTQSNQQLVDSVKTHVYQDQIPLDAEHETKLSGAVGWIRDARMNSDGSADAYVEWTDRGQTLLAGGQFRYVSPEWFKTWRDPATGKVHQNVVAGGAITTRPFFKDRVLRALVASEQGAEIVGRTEEIRMAEPAGATLKQHLGAEPPGGHGLDGVQSMSDNEMQRQHDNLHGAGTPRAGHSHSAGDFAGKEPPPVTAENYTEKIVGLEMRVQAAESLAATEKAAREAIAGQLQALQRERRHDRLVNLVQGGEWIGDRDRHVGLLEKLADTFGEDSEEVKGYAEQQAAIAEQLKKSSLFAEIGSSRKELGSGSPENKLDAMAKDRQKENADRHLTYEQAYAEVMATEEGKRLYSDSIRPARGI